MVNPKGKFPKQTLEGFPWIPGKVGKLLLELLELSPDPKELPAGILVSQSRGMGASSLSLADSRGWEWRGFLWSTEDSPGAAPPLPGTSGTANPGRVVALSWFLGTNSPPRPFGSCSAAPSPEREFRGGAPGWEFQRSLFPAVFQGAASQCSESKELLHPAGSGDPLGAARTLGDDPSPGIPMDFNGKTPLAELLFHERCYKSRPPCRLQLGFGGKNPQSLKKIPGFWVKPSFKIHGNTSLGMCGGKTFPRARPGPASSPKKMRAWKKGKGKRLGSGVDNGMQEVGKL